MNTSKKQLLSIAALAAIIITVVACKKDKDLVPVPPPVGNDPEVITTLKVTLVDSASVQPTVTATFRDPDGDGGNGPDIFDTIRIANNTTYYGSILLLNETESPADTVSKEILDEDHEHLFCFTPSGTNISIIRTDSDGTYEVGLQSTWRTGNASNGTTQIVLKHQVDGLKNGTCGPGSTDIEVTFVTEVQ